MLYHAKSILRKKNRKNKKTHSKSEQYSADPSEDGHTYDIDHLNIGEPDHDS